MKIVFLDFDGVLVNGPSFGSDGGEDAAADPRCVHALNHIIEATGAAIVVTSAWRIDAGPGEMRQTLDGWGVRGRYLGCTPDQCGPGHWGSRGSEIQGWLDEHRTLGVDAFVILDDIDDLDGLADKLVQTQFDAGLTMADASRAIAILLEEKKANSKK